MCVESQYVDHATGILFCTQAVTLLVDYGAQINEQDHEGNTPLHICCLCGHDSLASHLLQVS
jgi:ankyrin repeat protein